ncbi:MULTISPECIES: amidohydrolase/deacetylase family metallohydrolase [Virgibacillus]|uniref:Dihydroorotase n=1 Tax=Virgibacillus massiliensis TaxID=1462526 RepID=A0A024QA10_9BACI|nr:MULTISPECIES: amidohydrolase/deacetylase family metallohydrolase [Virgibacillus]EQB37457.1 hypothetical protein M948_02625 [Virgibacillus sp. CM-4]MYL40208.1 amidohydrolase/deacetylase family metallohydrolase [Virgibacillus massiliensis]CDQ39025.1 dihydroorotase [Virgibacillus massiliensis]
MKDRFVVRNVKRTDETIIDIVVEKGRIIDIAKAGYGQGENVYDYSGYYISSGWIDLHVHAFPEFDPYGDEVDQIGVKQGVTTIVDAGSCGADRIADLAASKRQAKTNLFAFLNVSRIGLARVDELSNLNWIDQAKAIHAAQTHHDIVIGLKARMSKSVVGESGMKPLKIARELSNKTALPLMVHIGSAPPKVEDIIPCLKAGDVITHFLNGKSNNLFQANGEPLKVLTDAVNRGVHLDVGHGTSSFSFKYAEAAKQHGIKFNTISTDIYRGNRVNGPVYSMAHVLTKFLYLGYSLEDVIDAVTIHAANWLDKPELGRIKVGDRTNLTLFTIKDKQTALTDSEGEQRSYSKQIQPKGVIINGEIIEC